MGRVVVVRHGARFAALGALRRAPHGAMHHARSAAQPALLRLAAATVVRTHAGAGGGAPAADDEGGRCEEQVRA
jgi:hypothetical protein